MKNIKTVALVGNPNVGKSTVFNHLTGLRQHTGNWPGKTVTTAWGKFFYKKMCFKVIDLPGTYSLSSCSMEEHIARDVICFSNMDVTVVVTDATCLERNINFIIQVLEIAKNVVVCVNLIDEAEKKKIHVDIEKLSKQLNVPVVATNARNSFGLNSLSEEIYKISSRINEEKNKIINYSNNVKYIISSLSPIIEKKIAKYKIKQYNLRKDNNFLWIKKEFISPIWLSIKLFDMDKTLRESLKNNFGFDLLNDNEIKIKMEEVKLNLQKNKIDLETVKDIIASDTIKQAEKIYKKCVKVQDKSYNKRDEKIDKFLTSKKTGILAMICLLGIIFWLTIIGSNYPSKIIFNFLFDIQEKLTCIFENINAPNWLHKMLILGIYRTLAWVVSVMLPPMAIFFPLFTILEDFGYLPRVVFNLDEFFKKAGAHGKQALTMCMGFGCNACGVAGCRIIDSKREKLIAVLTNVFVPCNGRFPILISIIAMFFSVNNGLAGTILSPFILSLIVIIGIFATLICSKILSKTLLKGMPSSFILEMPPYRKPQFLRVIIRSIFEKTFLILLRAMSVASIAGLIIFIMSNLKLKNSSLLNICITFLNPFAKTIGLDGTILIAFILGFPANEIVMPIIIMSYLSSGSILELESLESLKQLLVNNGWTSLTAICTMIFSLMHFPCGTTCLTIKEETKSLKWTTIAFLLPTICGIVTCFLITQSVKLFSSIF
ncbi:MAG: ferrous iron transport protein B [Oscillospiraceae bacterium]|nr:ferrous iron transport protein B [Oscillospiraceae bacterium]